VASRDLRKRIAEGRSVRYMIPRAVEVYIEDKSLYRA
jgi:nicotinate-nucleotide adenylyltransferase